MTGTCRCSRVEIHRSHRGKERRSPGDTSPRITVARKAVPWKMQGPQNHRQTPDRSQGSQKQKQNFLQRCVMSTALETWTDVAEKMPISAITGTPRDSSQIQPWTGTVTGVIFRHRWVFQKIHSGLEIKEAQQMFLKMSCRDDPQSSGK